MSPKPVTEHYAAKAADLCAKLMHEYAVPEALLNELHDANRRETLQAAHLATSALPIGTVARDAVAKAIDALRRS